MTKSTSRRLYLIGLVLAILSSLVALLVTSLLTREMVTENPARAITFSIVALEILLSALVGYILMVIAWIGALIKMRQLKRWGWFFALLFFCSPVLLAYIFIGPETPRVWDLPRFPNPPPNPTGFAASQWWYP